MIYSSRHGMLYALMFLLLTTTCFAFLPGDPSEFSVHIESEQEVFSKQVNAKQWLESCSTSFKLYEWQQTTYARTFGLENVDIDPFLDLHYRLQQLSMQYTTGRFEFLETNVIWNANISSHKNFSFNLTFHTIPQIPLFRTKSSRKVKDFRRSSY